MTNVYIVREQIGHCKICGKEDDLRFGVCFECADYVDGEQISPGKHRLWDCRNPANSWEVSVPWELDDDGR